MNAPERPRARQPSFRDRRGERTLLVYGELARWLVVDRELDAFLDLLDGRRTTADVVREHAARWGRPVEDVARDAEGILAHLAASGILDDTVPPVEPEAIRIANVTLNVTNRCDLACPWCYNARRRTTELPIDVLMDAVAAAQPIYTPDASFIILGGEPLLDFARTERAIARAEAIFRTPVLVSTNGTHLTAEAARALARRRVDVQVSLDAPDAARHDAVRGRGVFARAVAGVERLVAAGVPTILSMVYTRDNASDFEAYLDLARSLGAAEARFIPLRRIGAGVAHADLAPDPAAAFEVLHGVLERRPELRALLRRDWFTIVATLCRFSLPRTGCGVGRKVVFLDADGAVYPCPNHADEAHRCGTVTETPLARIVHESPVLARLRDQCRVDHLSRCRTCPFRYWCAGDCRGEALAATGDPSAPSPSCDGLRRLIPRLLWLLADDALPGWPAGPSEHAVRDVFQP